MTVLNTTIQSVVVYPDRARITRRGQVALQPGMHSLEIPGLPVQINADSVRAAAHGTAGARLWGVQVERTFYVETPAEQIHKLEEEILAVQDSLRSLDMQVETIKHYRTVLDLLSGHTETYATALAAGETSVDNQLALFDGLRGRSETLDAEQQKQNLAKRELDRRLEKLQNELNQQRSLRPRERYTALVEFEAAQAGEWTVELQYVISGAAWKPLYDLRLSEKDTTPSLEVTYLAQVIQQTGEPWEDVALSLSTARPGLAGKIPELDPWFIQPRVIAPMQPVRAKAAFAVQRSAEAGALPAEEMPAAAAPAMLAEAVTASVDSSGAAVTYGVPGKVAIPADGAPHKVTVASFSLAPKLDYATAPKLVEAAYRRAKLSNDSPYLLLPGAANLFAGDEFIGTTNLELTAQQGEIELYLGVDDRVKVERELKRREVGKQFIGGKRRLLYGYEIRLENLLPSEISIRVQDQIPVARHEEIKVKLESIDPHPLEQTELNLLNWELTLPSKEKRTLRFDFSVESPQGLEVMGLP